MLTGPITAFQLVICDTSIHGDKHAGEDLALWVRQNCSRFCRVVLLDNSHLSDSIEGAANARTPSEVHWATPENLRSSFSDSPILKSKVLLAHELFGSADNLIR